MMTLEETRNFAKAAHANHFGYDKQPHWNHVIDVERHFDDLLAELPRGHFTPEEEERLRKTICLHDTAEDVEQTGVSHEDLERAGVDPEVCRACKRLDRNQQRHLTYHGDMETMVVENDAFVLIPKLSDNRSNRYRERTPGKEGIQKRYDRAGDTLEGWFAIYKAEAWEKAGSAA